MTELVSTGVDVETQVELEQFLYREARLLQDMRFDEWLALFMDDATYRIPLRELTRFHGVNAPNQQIVDDDLAFDYINETKEELATRISRLYSGLAHIEEPQAVTTRLITNVEVQPDGPSSAVVLSNFHVLRVKEQRFPQSFFGSRKDVVVRNAEGQWRIASRLVVFAQRILEQPVSMLF